MAMSQNVLVIGGGGFLGIHAIRELRQQGHSVTSFGSSYFPPEQKEDAGVRIVQANLNHMDDAALTELLRGHAALVFAAGADDRLTPKRPCYPFFYAGNVAILERLLRLGKSVGVTRAVVLGSYFTYFNRLWPHLKLTKHHPYIRSRVEQQKVAFETVPEMNIGFLELPYIFGSALGKVPLWLPLVNYLRSSKNIFYTHGGTACVSAQSVGQAIAGAVEHSRGHAVYPIGDENLTWKEMLTRLARVEGRDIRVISLPNTLLNPILKGVWLMHYLQGKESGLDPRYLLDLQSENTFLDTAESRAKLGYQTGLLDKAFAETVAACPRKK